MNNFLKDIINGEFAKIIISEIKIARKGSMFILFFIFLCCFLLDLFFLRNIASSNSIFWIRQIYAVGLLLSFCCISVKLYNAIVDTIDAKKEEEQEAIKTKAKNQTEYEFIMSALSKDACKLLKDIIRDDYKVVCIDANHFNDNIINQYKNMGILEDCVLGKEHYTLRFRDRFFDFAREKIAKK